MPFSNKLAGVPYNDDSYWNTFVRDCRWTTKSITTNTGTRKRVQLVYHHYEQHPRNVSCETSTSTNTGSPPAHLYRHWSQHWSVVFGKPIIGLELVEGNRTPGGSKSCAVLLGKGNREKPTANELFRAFMMQHRILLPFHN